MWLYHSQVLSMTRLMLWLAGVKGRTCCTAGRPGAVRVLLFVLLAVLLLLLLFVLVSVLVLVLVLLSVFGVAVVVAAGVAVHVAGGVAAVVAVCAGVGVGVALAVGVGLGARARPLRICQRRPTLEWVPGVWSACTPRFSRTMPKSMCATS